MEPKFIGKAKLTSQGQLTVPVEARKDLKIDNDSEVYWYEFEGFLVLTTQLMSINELAELLPKRTRK